VELVAAASPNGVLSSTRSSDGARTSVRPARRRRPIPIRQLLQPRAEADLRIRFNNVGAVARSFPFIEPRSSTTTISRKTDPRNLKTNSSALFDI
jgi:hypothetical protein